MKIYKEDVKRIIAHAFGGTDQYYRNDIYPFYYTDGVRNIVNLGAFWILDLINSYQPKHKNVMFQVWELEVNEKESSAVMIMYDGINGNKESPIVNQKIPYTDFPCNITFYLENNILYLPIED